MATTMFQQNEANFKNKVEEFNDLYKQYALTQSKQLVFEKMKLVFVQAEQQFKFMEIEFGSFTDLHQKDFAQKMKSNKLIFVECQKKLRDLQSNLDKMPLSNVSSNSKKQAPSPIRGPNQDLHTQVKQLDTLDSRLLEAEDTQLTILDNIRNQKEKLLKAIEDTKEIQVGVKMTQRHATMIKNRQSYNKGILLSLICILTIGNILILYYKFMS
ncbi:unnamed protein product (macronuclear) [Paramecium tetraurelia]|uniref:t-SNARE coiled-coil homology domain-containing protein n=1 Tax=Paramecium tetraurelia TaxID=5888 RepID=A0EAE9_PARTE|nr:uncharacterized protein GSPATT00024998001 [Paramecium tetraurelia]CAK92266.1 unnamed protein product [Paramecium tetraurelia]|eukprot:XP_001459663.1 hypothetical protein (macronuclear) [Paramecium tetraurelia strain d4-2]